MFLNLYFIKKTISLLLTVFVLCGLNTSASMKNEEAGSSIKSSRIGKVRSSLKFSSKQDQVLVTTPKGTVQILLDDSGGVRVLYSEELELFQSCLKRAETRKNQCEKDAAKEEETCLTKAGDNIMERRFCMKDFLKNKDDCSQDLTSCDLNTSTINTETKISIKSSQGGKAQGSVKFSHEENQILVTTHKEAVRILVDDSGGVRVLYSEELDFFQNCLERAETRKNQCEKDATEEQEACLTKAGGNIMEKRLCMEDFLTNKGDCSRDLIWNKKACQKNENNSECLKTAENEKNQCLKEFEILEELCLNETKDDKNNSCTEEFNTSYCFRNFEDTKQLCGINSPE